jgi:hypothetical protein
LTHQLLDIGVERLAVADQLELDPIGLQRLTRQLGGKNRVARRHAARGVGQQPAARAQHVDQTAAVGIEADPADRHRHQLGSARFQRVEHDLLVRVPGGADKQPRLERRAGDQERVVGHVRYPKTKNTVIARSRRRRGNLDGSSLSRHEIASLRPQ